LSRHGPGNKTSAALGAVVLFAVAAGSFILVPAANPGTTGTTGPSGTPSPVTARVAQVVVAPGGAVGNIVGYYIPLNLTVVIGVNSTVKWTNEDMLVHSVFFEAGALYSGDINPGKSWSYSFTAPGVYQYHCYLHPWMVGTVVVKGSP
jgi:plastocyanin